MQLAALGLAGLIAVVIVYAARRRRPRNPRVRARARRLPWVHSTIHVTREAWQSWSGNLESRPVRLYCDDARGPWKSPRTLEDLRAIVRDARDAKTKVRAFGSSHSWSSLVPSDDGFLVDNRMIGAGEDGYYAMSVVPASDDGSRNARVTAPPGVLSSELEHWLWDMGYTLPASAFEDCFTLGGMVATATHGVGLEIPSVSDMVVAMTFVDGLGEVRRWSRETSSPDELAAIQVGLGCLGLIYDITLEVEPRYEVRHEARTYPYASLFADSDEARANLRALHERFDSVEFFWWAFTFSGIPFLSAPKLNPDVWVLATRKQIDPGTRPRPWWVRALHLQLLDLASMISCGFLMRAVAMFPSLSPLLPYFSSSTDLWVKARSGTWTMPQYDANHFVNATGVEFIKCIACEWSVPFEPAASDFQAHGWERVRKSFDVLHQLVVDAFHAHPFRDPRATPITIAVEMRTLAPSSALLSPYYEPAASQRTVRYAAPEIVTTANHPAWDEFVERANLAIVEDAATFGDSVRCHLAKPCYDLRHPAHEGDGMSGYLREQYRKTGNWQRFLTVREQLDPERVFLNPFLDELFYPMAERVRQLPPSHPPRPLDEPSAAEQRRAS